MTPRSSKCLCSGAVQVLLLSVLSLLSTFRTEAAYAAFSADGRYIYLRRFDGAATLTRIDTQSGVQSVVDLPMATGDHGFAGLASGENGRLLGVTGRSVWSLDASLEGALPLCSSETAGRRFRDIAYDPSTGNLLIAATTKGAGGAEGADGPPVHELLVLRRGETSTARVRLRRVERIDGMAFTTDGLLAFGYRGDLWLGRVRDEIIPQSSEDPVRADELAELPPYIRSTLEAFRYAPLATHETADTTGSQIGVSAVAVSANHAIVHASRINGSGWGHVVRLPLPVDSEPDSGSKREFDRRLSLDRRLETYRTVLDEIELLGDNGTGGFFYAPARTAPLFTSWPTIATG